MRLTLLRAKEALRNKAPVDKLEFRINRCCERLMLDGKFAGTLHRLALAAPLGQLTLPRHYRTIEGIRVDDVVYDITNQWYEMLPGKCGTLGFSMDQIRDLGDGNATIYELPAAGDLILDYTGGTNEVVTVYGTDANALPVTQIFNGKETHANLFTHIDRIHKDIHIDSVSIRLYHLAADLTQTNMALMAPKEEETYYRRYIMDGWAACGGSTPTTVIALAKLRHIEFTDDQDVLPFTNIGALELAMDALQYQDEDDLTLARQYWDDAVRILNNELGDTHSTNEIPTIRIIYPGNTAPKFTSHY